MRYSACALLALACSVVAWPSLFQPPEKRQASSAISPSAFRRRAYQSTAVLNGYAYIDGGEFSYETGSVITYQYSSTLIAIDLSTDWVNSSVTLESISKPAGVPDLAQGGLWVDENAGLLYTGFAGRQSTFGDDAFQPGGLWSFKPDGNGDGTWTNLNSTDQGFLTAVRPYGALIASGGGVGYMLGGLVMNSSSGQSWNSSGLVTFNFTTGQLTNASVNDGLTNGIDEMGGLIFVPNFGDEGVLIRLGGDQIGKITPGADDLLNLTTVSIYDVASGNWYDQTTSGNIPESRKEFCSAGIASANDTFEILVYAGWNGNLGSASVPYDEAYVLSLPAFQWFKASYPAANPRHGLTCVPVGGGQILTVGGLDTTQNGPDNLYDDVFNTRDPFEQGLAIFDMNQMAFAPSYTANAPSYTGASVVKNYYASNSRTPTWSNASLSAVFAVSSFPAATNTSTPSPSNSTTPVNNSSSHSDAGAIAGGVVGGVAGLAIIAGIAYFFLRRARQERDWRAAQPPTPVEVDALEPQRHEMPYDPSNERTMKWGADVPQSYRADPKIVPGPPRELANTESQVRHELA